MTLDHLVRRVHEAVPTGALVSLPAFNQRRYFGDLTRLGASLDEVQTQPLTCTPAPDGRFHVHDGGRRVRCAALGYTKRSTWWVVSWSRADGSPPSDSEIRRLCFRTNSIRQNWTPLEEALHLEQEINEAMAAVRDSSSGRGQRMRTAVIQALALDIGVEPRTIYHRMELLRMPAEFQDAVARGLVTPKILRRVMQARLPADEAIAVLKEAAELDGVDLSSDHSLPGDGADESGAGDFREGGGPGPRGNLGQRGGLGSLGGPASQEGSDPQGKQHTRRQEPGTRKPAPPARQVASTSARQTGTALLEPAVSVEAPARTRTIRPRTITTVLVRRTGRPVARRRTDQELEHKLAELTTIASKPGKRSQKAERAGEAAAWLGWVLGRSARPPL